MIVFRLRYFPVSVHVYCTLFAGEPGKTFVNCGNLAMRKEEFEAFREKAKFIEFVQGDQ